MKRLFLAVAASCVSAASYGAAMAFSMDSIEYWVGEGTNRCAVVVDFNDGSVENCSFAWGYRWNGEAPSMTEIMQEITAADKRLKMFASSGQWGSFIDAFGYDADGDGGTFTLSGYVKSDDDDIFPAIATTYDTDEGTGNTVESGNGWMLLCGTGPTFSDVSFTTTPSGMDYTYPEDGQWICWRVCPYVTLWDADGNFLDYSDDISSEYQPVAASRAFQMSNIRYWVGEGTNRCAVVIDFNDSSIANSSFAWGYRWNGEAPSMMEILQEITAADRRLKMFASTGSWGSFIDAFGYDADGDGGTFTLNGYVKSDDDDMFPAIATEYDFDDVSGYTYVYGNSWMQLYGTGLNFSDVNFATTPDGVDYTYPEDGQWICWRLCSYGSIYDEKGDFLDYSDDISSECLPVAAEYAFGMDNIRYWVGEGTNSCAVVVDFNDGSVENCSFAWGYRWNGEAPSMTEIMQEITAADKRLKMFYSSGQWGSFIDAFGYDADGDGGTFTLSGYVKSDDDDIFPAIATTYDTDEGTGNTVESGNGWMLLCGTGPTFSDVSFTTTPSGMDYTYPEDGQWICWRVCPYVTLWDAGGNYIDYSDDISSEYMPVAAYPSAARAATIPKVGHSSYANLEAAFVASRGGGSVTLPEVSSVDTGTKTVTVGTAEDGTLQTYVVPAYFDMAVSGSSVRLSLNAAATPTVAALPKPNDGDAPKPIEVGANKVTVVPSNVIDGLYYGLAVSKDINSDFAAPTEWVRAVNGTVVLERERSAGATCEFYRVRVSDADEAAR